MKYVTERLGNLGHNISMEQDTTHITADQPIANIIQPLDTVPTDTIDKTLGSVLPKVVSSHSAVFIFDDEEDNFAGLVSPYKVFYSSNFPHATKVDTALIVPPALSKETSLREAVSHMLSTKIYTLPVFDDQGKVVGVINGHDIMTYLIDSPEMLRALGESIKVRKPVAASIDSSVGDIYSQLKETGVTRIILTSATGAIAGIVTRNDLARAFIKPSVRRRYPSEGSVGGFYSRSGEKKFRTDYPVRRYATTLVNTLPAGTKKTELVKHLTQSQRNSVVLIDNKLRPTGLVSYRDLLQAVSRPEESTDVPLTINVPADDISEKEQTAGEKHLKLFWEKLHKRMDIEKIAVTTKVNRNTVNQPSIFSTTIKVTPIAGEPLIANSEARSYRDGLQMAITLIEKQRKRSHVRA